MNRIALNFELYLSCRSCHGNNIPIASQVSQKNLSSVMQAGVTMQLGKFRTAPVNVNRLRCLNCGPPGWNTPHSENGAVDQLTTIGPMLFYCMLLTIVNEYSCAPQTENNAYTACFLQKTKKAGKRVQFEDKGPLKTPSSTIVGTLIWTGAVEFRTVDHPLCTNVAKQVPKNCQFEALLMPLPFETIPARLIHRRHMLNEHIVVFCPARGFCDSHC